MLEYLLETEKHFSIKMEKRFNDAHTQTNPFSACIMSGNYQMFEYLINNVYTKKEEIIEYINCKTAVSRSPLYYACIMSGNKIQGKGSDDDDDDTIKENISQELALKFIQRLMQLGANPNPINRHHLIHRMIDYGVNVSFIKQVLALLLNEKKEYQHSFDWDTYINQISTSRSDEQDTTVTLCIKHNNLELLEYLCQLSKNYNTSLDMNDRLPLFGIMQPKVKCTKNTYSYTYYDFENTGDTENKNETENENENDKRRLRFAELLMMNNADPNKDAWNLVATLIRFENYKYKSDLLKILLNEKYKFRLDLNTKEIKKRILFECVHNGETQILEYILKNNDRLFGIVNDGNDKKLNVNDLDIPGNEYGATPLYRACTLTRIRKNNLNVARILMKYGANPNISPKKSSYPSIIVALLEEEVADKLEILKVLMNESKEYKYSFNWNESINMSSRNGKTALRICALRHKYDCLKYLLSIEKHYDTKLDINMTSDHDPDTVLSLCILDNKWDLFDQCVEQFGNGRIEWGYTFIHLAQNNNFNDIFYIVDEKRNYRQSLMIKDSLIKENTLFGFKRAHQRQIERSVLDYTVFHGQVSVFAKLLLMILDWYQIKNWQNFDKLNVINDQDINKWILECQGENFSVLEGLLRDLANKGIKYKNFDILYTMLENTSDNTSDQIEDLSLKYKKDFHTVKYIFSKCQKETLIDLSNVINNGLKNKECGFDDSLLFLSKLVNSKQFIGNLEKTTKECLSHEYKNTQSYNFFKNNLLNSNVWASGNDIIGHDISNDISSDIFH